MSTTRHMTAIPISTGLPRQSFIFWRAFESVMTLRDIFLPVVSFNTVTGFTPLRAALSTAFPLPLSTSALWLSLVFAAGFTPVQKGLTK